MTGNWVIEVSNAAMTLASKHWVLSLRILFQFASIKLGIIIFGHAHLCSCTAQIAERFEPNTVLWHFTQYSYLDIVVIIFLFSPQVVQIPGVKTKKNKKQAGMATCQSQRQQEISRGIGSS